MDAWTCGGNPYRLAPLSTAVGTHTGTFVSENPPDRNPEGWGGVFGWSRRRIRRGDGPPVNTEECPRLVSKEEESPRGVFVWFRLL